MTTHTSTSAATFAPLQIESLDRRLHAINAKLDQLKRDVLPTTPYLLRLYGVRSICFPTSAHLFPGLQAKLFAPKEQELQYMTFTPPPEGILHAHGQWDDGDGGLASSSAFSTSKSGKLTPNSTVKRRISLADYQNRGKGKTIGTDHLSGHSRTASSDSARDEPPNVRTGSLHSVDETMQTSVEQLDAMSPVKAADRPLKSTATDKADSAVKVQTNTRNTEEERKSNQSALSPRHQSGARPRTTKTLINISSDTKYRGSDSTSDHRTLTKSPDRFSIEDYKLPPLLSPSLPPEIEEFFTHAQSKKEDRTPLRAIREPEQAISQQLLVILKIRKKQNRKDLGQYLRLKSTPKKNHWLPTHKPNNEASYGSYDLTRKRGPNEDEPELPKKKRRPSSIEVCEIMTPALILSSPVLARNPEALAATLRNAASINGNAVENMVSRTTPGSANSAGSSSTRAQSKAHGTDQQTLRTEFVAESARLVNLARDLKHESDVYLKKDRPSDAELQLGLSIALEAVICFALAGLVADEPRLRQGRAGNTASWKSLVPFTCSLRDRSTSQKVYHALLCCLEGLTRGTIFDYESRHLLSGMQVKDGNQEVESQTMRKTICKELLENNARSTLAWQHAHQKFTVLELQNVYCSTWSRMRRSSVVTSNRDWIEIGRYGRDQFTLPLSPLNTSIDTLNTCYAILEEHCRDKKIKWKPKLLLTI